MRFLLPLLISVAAVTCSVSSSPLPVADTVEYGKALSATDFKQTIQSGLRWIEFYSPYCIHCKRFKPTWERLVDLKSEEPAAAFSMAQVDCISEGDLCNDQGVKSYPSLFLYEDGQRLDEYRGDRAQDKLLEYIDEKIYSYKKKRSSEPASETSRGRSVVALTPSTLHSFRQAGPVVVKFYTTWCGHCRKLAPVWEKLGEKLNSQLVVGEVECEAERSLCKQEGVQGYPTIYLYDSSNRHEYKGARTVEAIEEWTTKLLKSSRGMDTLRDTEAFDALASKEDAFFLYFPDPQAPSDTIKSLVHSATSRHGSTTLSLEVSSDELRQSFGLPPGGSFLTSIKNHARSPDAVLNLEGVAAKQDVFSFANRHRFPMAFELTQSNFQDVKSLATLVVIVPSDRADSHVILPVLIEASRTWASKARKLDALVTSMDSARWGIWLGEQYGYTHTPGHSQIIVADLQHHRFYSTPSQSIPLTSALIVDALERIASGDVKLRFSGTLLVRAARSVLSIMEGVSQAVGHHPFLIVFGLLCVLLASYLLAQRSVASDMDAARSRRLD